MAPPIEQAAYKHLKKNWTERSVCGFSHSSNPDVILSREAVLDIERKAYTRRQNLRAGTVKGVTRAVRADGNSTRLQLTAPQTDISRTLQGTIDAAFKSPEDQEIAAIDAENDRLWDDMINEVSQTVPVDLIKTLFRLFDSECHEPEMEEFKDRVRMFKVGMAALIPLRVDSLKIVTTVEMLKYYRLKQPHASWFSRLKSDMQAVSAMADKKKSKSPPPKKPRGESAVVDTCPVVAVGEVHFTALRATSAWGPTASGKKLLIIPAMSVVAVDTSEC
jgi:hypothetical protein